MPKAVAEARKERVPGVGEPAEDVQEHGYVAIKDAAGKTLAHRPGFQHNRKLRAGGAYDDAAIKELVSEVSKLASASASASPGRRRCAPTWPRPGPRRRS